MNAAKELNNALKEQEIVASSFAPETKSPPANRWNGNAR
jgi:hypothetical protein